MKAKEHAVIIMEEAATLPLDRRTPRFSLSVENYLVALLRKVPLVSLVDLSLILSTTTGIFTAQEQEVF